MLFNKCTALAGIQSFLHGPQVLVKPGAQPCGHVSSARTAALPSLWRTCLEVAQNAGLLPARPSDSLVLRTRVPRELLTQLKTQQVRARAIQPAGSVGPGLLSSLGNLFSGARPPVLSWAVLQCTVHSAAGLQ